MEHWKDSEWLRVKYETEGLSSPQIATLCNINPVTIRYWLKKHNIPTRTYSETVRLKTKNGYRRRGVKHSLESRRKISENHADVSGKNNPMYGTVGELSPNFGKEKSASTKEKLSLANKGKPNSKLAGENNPNWKGGRTSLAQIFRSTIQYETWRLQVYTRDKFLCQECKVEGKRLQAHHKQHLSKLFDKHQITHISQTYTIKEFWDIDNGTTLCKECHAKTHKRTTRKPSTTDK